MSVQALQKEVSKLNREDLFILMRYILDIMENNKTPISDAWKAELDYRDDTYRTGKENLKTWQEVKRQLHSK